MSVVVLCNPRPFCDTMKYPSKMVRSCLSHLGASGGCCCAVLQPCALRDHPAPQLSAGAGDTAGPGDGRAADGGFGRGVWERGIPAGESQRCPLRGSGWWGALRISAGE